MYIIKTNKRSFYQRASNFIKSRLEIILQTKENANVALAGGSTPMPILNLLAKEKIEWNKINFFQTDERIVPKYDVRSNFYNLTKAFFDQIESNTFPMYTGEKTPENSCNSYKKILKKMDQNKCIPKFDLIILGMGEDGHVASLFPESQLLLERKKTVMIDPLKRHDTIRMTLSLPVLTQALHTIILTKGSKKLKLLESKKARINLPIDYIIDNNKNITAICSKD